MQKVRIAYLVNLASKWEAVMFGESELAFNWNNFMLENNPSRFDFDVTVFGLGAMGTIVARTLSEKGMRVAGWNRSHGKAEVLREIGVHISIHLKMHFGPARCPSSCCLTRRWRGTRLRRYAPPTRSRGKPL
jgi:hypothetical protein